MGRHRKSRGWEWVNDPPAMVEVAKNRTRFMLLNLHLIDFDLTRLLVSAYLQGVADTANVAFQNGFIPPGCEPDEFTDIGAGI